MAATSRDDFLLNRHVDYIWFENLLSDSSEEETRFEGPCLVLFSQVFEDRVASYVEVCDMWHLIEESQLTDMVDHVIRDIDVGQILVLNQLN